MASSNNNATKAFAVLLVGIVAWGFLAASEVSDRQPDAYVPDPEAQRVRQEVIRRATDAGVLSKVEKPGDVPHVWVKASFYLMDFADKQKLCMAIHDYHFPDPSDKQLHSMRLRDSLSGKDVGSFSRLGLEIY